MSVKFESIDVRNGESLFVKINGSAEVMLTIVVSSKNGRCIVSGPFNTNERYFELTEAGLIESSREVQDQVLNT